MIYYLTADNYAKHREDIKSGDLLAWSGKGFFSRLIRGWTGETYSHVGVAWIAGGRVFIIEATAAGVVISPLSNHLPVYHLPTDIEWTPEKEEFAMKHIGDKYSYFDAIRGGLGLKPKVDKTWQCAELASAILGIELEKVEPGALVEYILSMNR